LSVHVQGAVPYGYGFNCHIFKFLLKLSAYESSIYPVAIVRAHLQKRIHTEFCQKKKNGFYGRIRTPLTINNLIVTSMPRRLATSGCESWRHPEDDPAASQEPAIRRRRRGPGRLPSRTRPAVDGAATVTSFSATEPVRTPEADRTAAQTGVATGSTRAPIRRLRW
jgi:hypothetical protein